MRQKFTQKERDNETGLDYFLARYYSSSQGRFTSPDEFSGGPYELYDFADNASENPTFYAELDNPQSLNKYQYTYNNPVNMTDPDGHCPDGVAGVVCSAVKTTASNIKDSYVAVGKTAGNIVIGAHNIGAEATGRQTIAPFEPSTQAQDRNMRALLVGLIFSPVAQKSGPANVIMAESKQTLVASVLLQMKRQAP